MGDYYTVTGAPITGSQGLSSVIRAEFTSIATGFGKLPAISGFPNKAVIVNGGGTALILTSGGLSLAGDLTTTGAFATTLVAGAAVSITLPIVSGLTLATLTGTETLTNKTLTSPTLTTPTLTTPTISNPAFSGTSAGTLTLVGATLDLTSNTLTGTLAQFNTACSDADFVSVGTIQDGTGVYVATVAGTADVITLTASPAIAAYVAGQTFRFIASGANTTNVTVAINGLAAKAITKNGTTALVAGDISSGTMVQITYDGTRFILPGNGASTRTVSQGGTGLTTLTAHAVYVGNGTSAPTALAVGATNTVLHGLTGADPAYSAVVEADITLADNTTNNVTSTAHGFCPKAPADATKFLNGANPPAYAVPVGTLTAGTLLTKNPVVFGSTTTQAHGLAVEPHSYKAILECVTGEQGYSIGDRLAVYPTPGVNAASAAFGMAILADTTNVNLLIATSGIFIIHKTNWSSQAITAANWKVLVTPYKLN